VMPAAQNPAYRPVRHNLTEREAVKFRPPKIVTEL
jgi:hypothetical protein